MDLREQYKFTPKEHIWVAYYDSEHNLKYLLTSKSKTETATYFLYHLSRGQWMRIAKGPNPAVLEHGYIKLK